MKRIRIFFIVASLITIFSINNANASSISYDLKIDKNRHFYETVTYTIENDTTNNYLLKVLSDTIYFDKDNSIAYTKTISKQNNISIVTLKHDYIGREIKKSRILNECFDSFVYKETEKRVTYYASDPFNCAYRADDITISVTSDIDVILNTADQVNNNTYIWNKIDKEFMMDLSLGEDPTLSADDGDDVIYDETMPGSYDGSIKTFPYIPVIIGGSSALIILFVVYMRFIRRK